jgi:CheY-like chemotaxis protein
MTTLPPAGGALDILVVDDERDTVDSLVQLLALWGHRALAAYDGPSALALYADCRPAVVVLDIDMPRMDGCEVARRIRRDYPAHRALIVAVSGHGRAEDLRRCAEAGADTHLLKPADPDALRQLLAAAARCGVGPGAAGGGAAG